VNVYHAIAVARASLPKVTFAQRVVDKIVQNALVYETETGESLVGFAVRSPGKPEPDLYVLDTIAPDDTAIRRGAYFEQGDDLQADIFNWWFDNWNHARQIKGAVEAKWNIPLAHLGDWHKHPGHLVEPSWGDTDTARQHISDSDANTPQLIVLLATLWDKLTTDVSSQQTTKEPQPIYIPADESSLVRLDCWYMSRLTRRFVRLEPQIAANNTLPALPVIGWHLAHPERMSAEIAALSREGYAVSVEQYDTDHTPPLEICLSLAKRSSPHILIAVTQADYPASMPTIRVVPAAAMKDIPESADLFVSLWQKSEPLSKDDYPVWHWSPDHTILDLAKAVEAKLLEGSAA